VTIFLVMGQTTINRDRIADFDQTTIGPTAIGDHVPETAIDQPRSDRG
jgi:hypothetical protein